MASSYVALIGTNADHRPNVIRIPRTQREAGVNADQWASRAPGLPRSWLDIAAKCVLGLALASAVVALLVL